MLRPTTIQTTSRRFIVEKYCEIFAESRGTSLRNGEINSNLTKKHVTLCHVIKRSNDGKDVFYVVCPDIYHNQNPEELWESVLSVGPCKGSTWRYQQLYTERDWNEEDIS